ncbi:NADH-quinone oxidoreductase subunit C [Streptomyces sp. NPDC004788]
MTENFTDSYAALPDSVTELFGEEATAERAYDLLTVDVPTASWIAALEIARDKLGLTYFDWLSAVDEPGVGFRVCAHVASVGAAGVRRLLLRTTVPHASPSLPSAIAVYAGAAWHERETYEMFGVTFTDHPHLVHLLLPENFEGHPLRKDFVLAARVAKAWPGAKEPGESHDPAAPKRRQMLPPGVPDPNDWGPLKGQLPPAPSRPARAAAGDRPVRRARTAGEGSASQAEGTPPVRRTRSATAGSASQRGEATPVDTTEAAPAAPAAPAGPRRARSVSAGSASQRPEPGAGAAAVAGPAAGAADAGPAAPAAPAAPRPEPTPGDATEATPAAPDAAAPVPTAGPETQDAPSADTEAQAAPSAGPEAQGAPSAGPETEAAPSAGPEAQAAPSAGTEAPVAPPAGPRRNRSASAGSASRRTEAAGTPDTAKQRPAPARSSDAPWHHARPAFDEEPKTPAPQAPPAEGGAEAPAADADADGAAPTPEPPTPEPPTTQPPTTDPDGGDSA